jgi:ABC-type sulfate transport system substrate-binding protein
MKHTPHLRLVWFVAALALASAAHAGDWARAQKAHFANDGTFDQIGV